MENWEDVICHAADNASYALCQKTPSNFHKDKKPTMKLENWLKRQLKQTMRVNLSELNKSTQAKVAEESSGWKYQENGINEIY
jgi:hypothetical protein